MVCKTNRLVNQLNWPIADIEKMWLISRFTIIDWLIGATLIAWSYHASIAPWINIRKMN